MGSQNVFRAHKLTTQKLCVVVDGGVKLNCGLRKKCVIKAGQKVFSVACASIIAKIRRDKYMLKLNKMYPQYGFNLHKGYGTKIHYDIITKQGLTPFHRKTFCLSEP